jgi:hypothetical protein
MITLEKLRIYEAFNGDLDGWVRSSTGDEKSFIGDADWYLIDALLTDIAAADSGRASPAFAHEVETRLATSTADDATRDALRALPQRLRNRTP